MNGKTPTNDGSQNEDSTTNSEQSTQPHNDPTSHSDAESCDSVQRGKITELEMANQFLDEENKWLAKRFADMTHDIEQEFGKTLDYVIQENGVVFIGDNTPKTLAQEMMIMRKNLEWEVRELRKLCKEASHLTCQFYEKRWQDWMKNWNRIKDNSHASNQGQ